MADYAVTNPDFNPSGSEQIAAIKEAGNAYANIITKNTPAGRRQSLALTHLETAIMFAVKAAAVGDD